MVMKWFLLFATTLCVTCFRSKVRVAESHGTKVGEPEPALPLHEDANASTEGQKKKLGEFEGFRVLIPFASAGGGHKAAGRAIMQQLSRDMPEVEVVMVDTMEDNEVHFRDGTVDAVYPNDITKSTKTDFFKWREKSPGLVKFASNATDFIGPFRNLGFKNGIRGDFARAVAGATGWRFLGVPMIDEFDEFMLRHSWDLVINTHFFTTHSIASLRTVSHMDIPSVTVVTDYHAHAFWLSPEVDHYFVSSPNVEDEVSKATGVEVTVSGIPVDPKVADLSRATDTFVWEQLGPGIEAKLKPPSGGRLILVTTTSEGIEDALSVWERVFQFARANPLHRVVAVAARLSHSRLPQEQIDKGVKGLDVLGKELATDIPNVEVLGFIPTMPEYMRLADVIISKPGGLTVSESLALGCAWLIMEPWLLDVEYPNRDFLVDQGIARNVKKPSDATEIIDTLGDLFGGNGDEVETMKANALRFGHPYAAKAVSDYVAKLFREKGTPQINPPSLCCCSVLGCLPLSSTETNEGCALRKKLGVRKCPRSCGKLTDMMRRDMSYCDREDMVRVRALIKP